MSHIPTIFGMDGMDLSMLRIASDSTQKGRALPGRAFVESDDSLGHPGRRKRGLGLYLSPFCESRPRGIALRPTHCASGGSPRLPSPEGSTRRKDLRCAPIARRATTPLHRALDLRSTVNGETTADGAAKPARHACARRRTVPAQADDSGAAGTVRMTRAYGTVPRPRSSRPRRARFEQVR
jgi:hypothetical protein